MCRPCHVFYVTSEKVTPHPTRKEPGMTTARLSECAVCDRKLPRSAYYESNRWVCRECLKARYRKWYAANRERRAAASKARLERIANGEPSNSRVRVRRRESNMDQFEKVNEPT
jgi:hypothetical protein